VYFYIKHMDKVNILGTEINKINYSQTLSQIEEFMTDGNQHYIVTPNPEILLKACHDTSYRAILNNADLSLPDGIGLIIGSWFLGDPLYSRVTGIDLCWKIAELAQRKKYKLFLLGAWKKTSQVAKTKLELKYQSLEIVGAEEGFKNIQKISIEENEKVIEKIKNSGAEILLVAFGAPWQEKWIWENLPKITNVKIAMGVGGAIDFIAGQAIRAPKIFRKIGLEWLWRLIMDPSRINRILNATLKYSLNLIKWKIHILKPYRQNVVGVIFNYQKDKVLILNRKEEKNHWQFPQGGIEKNESPEQAILREMEEETGLKNLKIIGQIDEVRKYYWPIHWPNKMSRPNINYNQKFCGQEQRVFFLQQNKEESPHPQEEHNEYQWINPEEIKNKIHPIRINLNELILKNINQYLN
jgi:N-acetylglucosaminyldiphosphoundecaprenol N-acetyl-beta-D-mannosaminyltransferase